MITEIALENLKCFRDERVPFGALTVLTGVNGGGKSTVVQALLLARQAEGGAAAVALNGPDHLALGEAADMLNVDAPTSTIAVTLVEDRVTHRRFEFTVPLDRALYLPVQVRPEGPPPAWSGEALRFTYLCAERLGPRDQQAVVSGAPGSVGVGARGEHVAQLLTLHDRAVLRPEVRHPAADVDGVLTLTTNVEHWMKDVVRDVQIEATWPPGLSTAVLRFRERGTTDVRVRPTNTAFGVSYALPVIVAGLLTEPAGVMVVENPEAHLHPAAQSRMGRFLARVAASGVQVVVETHSDHVLNGMRLAVAEGSGPQARDVSVVFFDTMSRATAITMTAAGRMSAWPEGFFDQIDTDLAALARAARPHRRASGG